MGEQNSVAVGPDLTEIGRYRGWKWLAESILHPNSEIGREWKTVKVALESGEIVDGILRGETEKEVSILVSRDEVRTIPKGEIRARRDGELSRMPDNYRKTLTFQQISDLIAYLGTLKGERNGRAAQGGLR